MNLGPLTDAEYDDLLAFNGRHYSPACEARAATLDERRMAALQARYDEHGAAWMDAEPFLSCPAGRHHELAEVESLVTGERIGAICENCDHRQLSHGFLYPLGYPDRAP